MMSRYKELLETTKQLGLNERNAESLEPLEGIISADKEATEVIEWLCDTAKFVASCRDEMNETTQRKESIEQNRQTVLDSVIKDDDMEDDVDVDSELKELIEQYSELNRKKTVLLDLLSKMGDDDDDDDDDKGDEIGSQENKFRNVVSDFCASCGIASAVISPAIEKEQKTETELYMQSAELKSEDLALYLSAEDRTLERVSSWLEENFHCNKPDSVSTAQKRVLLAREGTTKTEFSAIEAALENAESQSTDPNIPTPLEATTLTGDLLQIAEERMNSLYQSVLPALISDCEALDPVPLLIVDAETQHERLVSQNKSLSRAAEVVVEIIARVSAVAALLDAKAEFCIQESSALETIDATARKARNTLLSLLTKAQIEQQTRELDVNESVLSQVMSVAGIEMKSMQTPQEAIDTLRTRFLQFASCIHESSNLEQSLDMVLPNLRSECLFYSVPNPVSGSMKTISESMQVSQRNLEQAHTELSQIQQKPKDDKAINAWRLFLTSPNLLESLFSPP